MSDSYSFTGGNYDPVSQIDVMPEQEAVNAKIERSEAEYFEALRKNDRDRVANTKDLFDALGSLSKSAKNFADAQYKKNREEDEARGAMLALTSDYNYEDIQALIREENNLRMNDINLAKTSNEIEQETGRYVLGQEIQGLSGWAKYSFVKTTLQREAKDYQTYKRTARSSVSVVIDRNGVDTQIGYGEGMEQPQNEAEADAIDAKIKFEFAKRFVGVNPVLLQATVKGEIDRVDEADRAQRAKEFDDAAKKQDAADQRGELITSIKSSPMAGRDTITHWIEKNKFKYGDDIRLARVALKDMLVEAVRSGELTLPEALAAAQEKMPNRGSKDGVDMAHWKEWRTIETDLMEANNEWRTESEDFKENAMLADIEMYKEGAENATAATNAAFVKYLRTEYPGMPIPEEGRQLIYGYKDDTLMTNKFEMIMDKNGGYVTESDLEGASPALKNKMRREGKVQADSQSKIMSVGEKGTGETKFVKNRAAEALELKVGVGETTSLAFDTLLENLETEYVIAYNRSLALEKDPAKAREMARDAVSRLSVDQKWIGKNSERVYTSVDQERVNQLNAAQRKIKPTSGNWRTEVMPSTKEAREELKTWAAGGGKGPVPTFYSGVAFPNGIHPKAYASAQASLLGYKGPKVDEGAEKLSPTVKAMLFKNPTSKTHEVAKKELENEENMKKENPYGLMPLWKKKQNQRLGL